MQLQSYPSTSEKQAFHTFTPSMTTAGPMGVADARTSLDTFEDLTARQFGLQAQTSGTSPILSSICIVSQDHWNTLRWEERTGVQTLEVQFWDNSQVKDTNPQEFWKYCKPKFREQLHVTSPPEVHKAVQTLHRFAHKKLRQAENLQKFRKLSPSTNTSEKTPYCR